VVKAILELLRKMDADGPFRQVIMRDYKSASEGRKFIEKYSKGITEVMRHSLLMSNHGEIFAETIDKESMHQELFNRIDEKKNFTVATIKRAKEKHNQASMPMDTIDTE